MRPIPIPRLGELLRSAYLDRLICGQPQPCVCTSPLQSYAPPPTQSPPSWFVLTIEVSPQLTNLTYDLQQNTMSTTDMYVLTIPPETEHTHTIILLHGSSDTADNFSRTLRQARNSQGSTLFTCFPSFKWVLPEASLRRVASSNQV